MKLDGTYEVDAPAAVVWEALTRADSLSRILPGCDHLEETGENRFAAVVSVKVGPIRARFRGKVALTDLVQPVSFQLAGEGDGGASGHAKGTARIVLHPLDDGARTRIAYEAETNIGGKLAALGGRLVEAVSARNIELMMQGLAREVATACDGASEAPGAAPAVSRAITARAPVSAASEPMLAALLRQGRLQTGLLALIAALLLGPALGLWSSGF
ncbi:CoxG family protein [Stappia indica]|uniref:CoxG family protein n=1 Tax=Stappia indica TaxID=538381 RepID=UPI001CD785E7|nr:carbon monoxide dehydrogenase subunit G [Stappia indica]MCA1299726.1 carbon monoxide dehydrogenase subunit G [Stappia indica]